MFHSVTGTTRNRKLNGLYAVTVDCAHAIRCVNTRNNSLRVICPSVDGILGGKPAIIASLLMVPLELFAMVIGEFRLKPVVFTFSLVAPLASTLVVFT